MYFEVRSLGAHGALREGQGGDVAVTRGAPRIRAGRFTRCLRVVKPRVGRQSNSSLTTLCFEVNLNRAVKRVSRLYKFLL